jgi:hypothetical protein
MNEYIIGGPAGNEAHNKIDKARKLALPNLEDPISLYQKKARFCQTTPEDSHLSVIFKLRETFSNKCDYLEIGSLFGFSMVNATQSKTQGKFVGVDLFESSGKIFVNDYTPDISERNLSKSKTESLVDQCNIHNHEINFIKGNSQSNSTFSKVLNVSDHYDLMFLDGDHSFAGTFNDFKKYSPLLRKGGFLLFDDHDYDTISSVMDIVKNMDGEYEWIDWPEYSPKFSGFFLKLIKD